MSAGGPYPALQLISWDQSGPILPLSAPKRPFLTSGLPTCQSCVHLPHPSMAQRNLSFAGSCWAGCVACRLAQAFLQAFLTCWVLKSILRCSYDSQCCSCSIHRIGLLDCYSVRTVILHLHLVAYSHSAHFLLLSSVCYSSPPWDNVFLFLH